MKNFPWRIKDNVDFKLGHISTEISLKGGNDEKEKMDCRNWRSFY